MDEVARLIDGTRVSDSIAKETIVDRLFALTDAIPPKIKYTISRTLGNMNRGVSNVAGYVKGALWVLATISIVTVLPVTLDLEREQMLVQEDMQMNAVNAKN